MARIAQKITTFLMFNNEAEEAMRFYVSIFPDSSITSVSHYNPAVPGRQGTVMLCRFRLAGQDFIALNGGPDAPFTEAVSLLIQCDTQEEVDYYWNRLSEGGSEIECGWLKDRFGVFWQVTPTRLLEFVEHPDDTVAANAMRAMFSMKRIVIADIEKAVREAGE